MKIENNFSCKVPTSDDWKSFLAYTFTCASYCSSYFGETYCYFKSSIEEHIKTDKKSNIVKYLYSTAICFDSYSTLSFKISDKTSSKLNLKIQEALFSFICYLAIYFIRLLSLPFCCSLHHLFVRFCLFSYYFFYFSFV